MQVGGEEPEQAGGGERLHLRRQEGGTMIGFSACLLVRLSYCLLVRLSYCLLVCLFKRLVKECSNPERWVVEYVEKEVEEEVCQDQPKPYCEDIQVL